MFNVHKVYKNLPVVAIVGRPNVGKSTLFNRFLHTRRSITDPTPGVTRDPVVETAFINDMPITLVDTGGFKLTRSDNEFENLMDTLVIEKTLIHLSTADRIVLLLDAGEDTSEDEEFITFLRPYWDKVIAAVNKTEGGRLVDEGYRYFSYGFKELFFISAEHGDNISAFAEQLTKGLDFSQVCEDTKDRPIRISIIGKPNTGKSTLSNYLTKNTTSIVSDVAGTTRDVVHTEFQYKNKLFELQDTAGIRRKAKVTENIEYYSVNRAIQSLKHADIVFHLIDAQEGLTEQDKKIIIHAANRGLGLIFVLNKWDLMSSEKKALRKAEQDIRIMFGKMEYAPIIAISAKNGFGIKKLLTKAVDLYRQLNKKIETSAVNLALRDWITATPPPQSKHFSFKYMVQTGTCPVEFIIFSNRPENVTEAYTRYVINRIRKDLGFTEIPVLIKIKPSRKSWREHVRERTSL